ncbi:MAG: LptF/LptG family permease, partial [Bdellovibrionaceae bacterium]|nr:LptF/LptG family permease [Pseudobdellovibrionaceae bacterium]
PILVFVVLISGISFWLGDRVLPVITQKKNYVYFVEIRKQPGLYSTVKTNKIWYRSNNILFNMKTFQPDRAYAEGLTMYYFDGDWQLIQIISAASVALKGESWELTQGHVTLFPRDGHVPLTQDFKQKTIIMGEDSADLQSTSQTSDILSLKELERFIQRNKEAGLDTLRYEVDYHAKFSFAFAAFVMSFIGIPFSVSRQRSGGTALNIGLCVGLAFAYWAAYSSGLTLGHHGALPPILAAWVPNLAVMVLSTVILMRLKK